MAQSVPHCSPAQLEIAKRLLAREGAYHGECARAAGKIYDKLQTQLTPLVGAGIVPALLSRSAKLVKDDFSWLAESAAVESPSSLRNCLGAREPVEAMRAAEALFGTFFTLFVTFIGERVTREALRSTWPSILFDTASMESEK